MPACHSNCCVRDLIKQYAEFLDGIADRSIAQFKFFPLNFHGWRKGNPFGAFSSSPKFSLPLLFPSRSLSFSFLLFSFPFPFPFSSAFYFLLHLFPRKKKIHG